MTLTVPELGALFLLLFGVFHFLGIFATIRAVLVFLGIVVVGTFGFIGRMLSDVGLWAQHAFGSVVNWAIGVPLAAGLFVILAIVLVHDLHPKNAATKRTGWVAIACGLLVAVGVAGIPALAGLRDGIVNLMGSATGAINSASGR
jgi:hypothetical protein